MVYFEGCHIVCNGNKKGQKQKKWSVTQNELI